MYLIKAVTAYVYFYKRKMPEIYKKGSTVHVKDENEFVLLHTTLVLLITRTSDTYIRYKTVPEESWNT